MTLISAGWPDDKLESPNVLALQGRTVHSDGLAVRGARIIISHSTRTEMTTRAHRSHLTIQYTINTAKDIMHWPRMTADLTEEVQRCETC